MFAIHPQWLRSFGYHMTFGDLSHLYPGFAKKLIAVQFFLSKAVQQEHVFSQMTEDKWGGGRVILWKSNWQ